MIRLSNQAKIRAMLRSALGGVLVAAAFGACGGRAESAGGLIEGSPFLAECTGSCGGGLECLDRVCTRPCSVDAECVDVSTSAECLERATYPDRGSSCGIDCRSDEDCQELGAGSYCSRVFCVAGNLESLPESFDTIELRQIREPLEGRGAPFGCDYGAFETRIKVSLRTGEMFWSRCEQQDDSGGYSESATTVALDELALDFVRDAYRELALSRERECAPSAELIALDLELRDGPDLLFADEEHSGCPLASLGRVSFVSGLAELYDKLAGLVDMLD
jgi:hypothetical protein